MFCNCYNVARQVPCAALFHWYHLCLQPEPESSTTGIPNGRNGRNWFRTGNQCKNILLTLCHIYHICVYYYIYVRLHFIHELLCTTVCTLSACKKFDPDSAKAQSRNVAKNSIRSIRIRTSTANCLSQNMSASQQQAPLSIPKAVFWCQVIWI